MNDDIAISRGHPSYVWRFGQDRRLDMMRPRFERPIGQQHIARRRAPGEPPRGGDAVTLGGDADDFFGWVSHRQAA